MTSPTRARMIARLATYVTIPAIVFVLPPMIAGWSYLLHPAPWAGFFLGFLTLASQPPLTPTTLVADVGDRRSALLILVALVVTNIAAVAQFSSGPGIAPSAGSPWVIVGLAVAGGGMALRLWAIRTLGKFFTSSVVVQEGQHVITAGPYRWMRHPSYTGSVLTVLGTALAFASWIALLLVGGLVLPAYLYRIKVEEQTMLARLGDAYAAYRARTPALLPLWPPKHV